MKCRECSSCTKGFWASQPESYICIGVPEPFVVTDRDAECRAYPEKIETKVTTTCTYCDKMDELYGDFRGTSYVDDMHTLRLHTHDCPRFNYCPMCGKKLTKENNNEQQQ